MRITCPYCGERDHQEFTYRGDAAAKRPKISNGSIEDHASFVFDRANPAGEHRELWNHTSGCRQHVIVTRNTLTHEISDIEAVGAWAKTPKSTSDKSPIIRRKAALKAPKQTTKTVSTRSKAVSTPSKPLKTPVKPHSRSKK